MIKYFFNLLIINYLQNEQFLFCQNKALIFLFWT